MKIYEIFIGKFSVFEAKFYIYNRISMARTSLEPLKFVRDTGSSSL